MNEHFKNIWYYSFGFENHTAGVVYAETREEARAKVIEAYQREPAQLTVRPFGKFDCTCHEDVIEVTSL